MSCITNLGKARRLVAEPTSKNRSFINLHVLLRKRRSDIEGMQTRELFYKHLQRLRFQYKKTLEINLVTRSQTSHVWTENLGSDLFSRSQTSMFGLRNMG